MLNPAVPLSRRNVRLHKLGVSRLVLFISLILDQVWLDLMFIMVLT